MGKKKEKEEKAAATAAKVQKEKAQKASWKEKAEKSKPKCTGKVDVYQHNFSGWKASFKKGTYNMAQFKAHGAKNDDASSVVVPSGCKAELYEHDKHKGWKVTVGPGKYDLGSLMKKGFKNDKMSSIKVKDN